MKEYQIEITEEIWNRAVQANSGGCVVAEAIKAKYPHLRFVKVDVATIRFSDPEAGEKYIILTPDSAAESLLYFDQGWEEKLPKKIRLRTPVRVMPMTRSASNVKRDAQYRARRTAELEAKEASGEELTAHEKGALTLMRKPKKTVKRATTEGKTVVEGEGPDLVIRGGRGIVPDSERNPNLLGGRDRHFGGKKLKPSEAVMQVVKQEVEAALAAERAKQTHK
jgi:hypothetical protein